MAPGRLKVAVGLSGGVDSSVAAALLTEAGHEVTGITMRVYDPSFKIEGGGHSCFGPGEDEEIAACERLCDKLGVPFRAIDLREEYRERVIEYFRAEYRAGRTPNPCVRCNAALKFGFLVERARESGLDIDYFATGHYARIGERGGKPCLMRALDPAKDQSYFLYRLGPDILSRTIFPLGSMRKIDVRAKARELGLESADAAESQDFIGGDYSPLFRDDPPSPGDIVDDSGRVMGRHRGLPFYTIGQRRGVGVAAGDPVYVKRIDAAENRIVVGPDESLYASTLIASDAVFQGETAGELRVHARIRQNHRPAPALMRVLPGKRLEFIFDDAQRGIAPGQSVVAYDGEDLISGGIIETSA
jgi:tRNA-uridine 2-sulfurtransferase